MSNVRDILLDIGYSNITDNGREFRMKPLYRDSSSNTVLSVRKDTGHFIDFSKNSLSSSELNGLPRPLSFPTFRSLSMPTTSSSPSDLQKENNSICPR